MQVCPEDAAGHFVDGVEHVVVVVPVDADVDEAEDVAEHYRQDRLQGGKIAAGGHFHLQDHDGDDDGQHAVAEGFQSVCSHGWSPGCVRYLYGTSALAVGQWSIQEREAQGLFLCEFFWEMKKIK